MATAAATTIPPMATPLRPGAPLNGGALGVGVEEALGEPVGEPVGEPDGELDG